MKTKEQLSKQLLDMKFVQTTANTFKKEVDGKMYLVDFKNKQVCRQEGEYGMTRIDNDEADATLMSLQELCEYVVEPTADDVPEEVKDEIVDQPIEEEIPAANNLVPIQTTQKHTIRGIKGIVPQLCECGKIKIGKKGQVTTSRHGNQFRPPSKLDHFEITTTEKQNDDYVIDHAVMATLPDNPTQIPVMLLYDSPDLNFFTSYAYYDSAQCQCRGDGEYAVKADGTQIECNPETCKFATTGKCKPNGVLSVVLRNAPRVGGVYKFRTTGWNSIRNLMSSIEFIHGLTGGRLVGLPLMLTLQQKTTVIPGTKTPTTIYHVNLEYMGTIEDLLNTAANRLATADQVAALEAKATEMRALPESAEECKDIVEEFYFNENCKYNQG